MTERQIWLVMSLYQLLDLYLRSMNGCARVVPMTSQGAAANKNESSGERYRLSLEAQLGEVSAKPLPQQAIFFGSRLMLEPNQTN